MRRALLVLVALVLTASPAAAQAAPSDPDPGSHGPVHPMVFPVVGDVTYTDTFGAPRRDTGTHMGQDLMGRKMQQEVAAADGRVTYLQVNHRTAGNFLEITGDDGWVYSYLHLNNDTPGTDDGNADPSQVFGPGIEKGARVVAGQLVGYMGDSGDAEDTGPHVHFELKDPTGTTVNAYASLQAARRVDAPVNGAALAPSPIPRLAGADRVATAVAVSRAGWPNGATEVVIAAGDRYAEALPASVLASARNGPLLVTLGTTLPSAVSEEVARLRATTIDVVGSVPPSISDALVATGRTITRIGVADDATATAVALARAVGGTPSTAVLVNDSRFADGVSAAAIASGRGWPVLLTTSSVVPQATVDAWRALGVKTIEIVGGTSVIGDNIAKFIASSGRCAGAATCAVERLAGADRYATSVAVNQRSITVGGRSLANVLLGTGADYPDALASGPLAAKQGGVALLVDGTGTGADTATRAYLAGAAASVKQVSILGGAAAVSSAADREVQVALGKMAA